LLGTEAFMLLPVANLEAALKTDPGDMISDPDRNSGVIYLSNMGE
jgi:hypothetical protein